MEKNLKTTEAQRRASMKWQKEHYVRIPLDVEPEYKAGLKKIAASRNMTVGLYIKQAIAEKAEREGVLEMLTNPEPVAAEGEEVARP